VNDDRRPPPVTRLGPPAGAAPAIEDYGRALFRATPRLWVTLALVLANVAVFAVQVLGFGISPMMPEGMDLLRWGAAYGPRVVHGEPWRLLTSMFLHAGLIHIGSNMYVLWLGGRLTERMFGNVSYLVIYVVSGLAGAITAIAFGSAGPLVGASGAVFGVFGALGGYLLVQRKNVPPDFLRSMRGQLVQFVLINTVISLAIPQISGWAHAGGFLMGFVVGMLVARPPTAEGVRGRALRAVVVGAAMLLVLSATLLPLRSHFAEDPGAIGSPFQRRTAPEDAFRDVVGN
jgi:rhomboid protease GluP